MNTYQRLLGDKEPEGTRALTQSLFYERVNSVHKPCAIYSLKDKDHTVDGVVYPSLFLLYMAMDDPTEYLFATEYFASYEQWETICNTQWMKPIVERWRKELDLRMKANALIRIRSEAKTNSREALAANKYILERKWDQTEANKRGRPSKDEIKKAANEIAQNEMKWDEDLAHAAEILSSKKVAS